MELNGSYSFRAPKDLIYTDGTGGWKSVGALMNGAAAYLTYKDQKEKAAKAQKAQEDYFNLLKDYLQNKGATPAEAEVEATKAVVEETPSEAEEPREAYAGQNDVLSWIAGEKKRQANPLIAKLNEGIEAQSYQSAPDLTSLLGTIGG